MTTLLAVGASVSVLPPVLRKVLPEKVVDLPVSKPLDAALAKAFPKVNYFTPLLRGYCTPYFAEEGQAGGRSD